MAFKLDQQLSYQNLEECQFADFGYLEECIDCIKFENCEDIQHGAMNLSLFFCADFKEREGDGATQKSSPEG